MIRIKIKNINLHFPIRQKGFGYLITGLPISDQEPRPHLSLVFCSFFLPASLA